MDLILLAAVANVQYLYSDLVNTLLHIYPEKEAESIALLVFEYLGIERVKIQARLKSEIDEDKVRRLSEIKSRLAANEPVQYVLEEADFYKLKFKVGPDVLIPRQETEELVAMIVGENALPSPRILDIGTGSGCIAISLKDQIPGASVSGCDVSANAINIALENADRNSVEVSFFEKDVLHNASIPGPYDIIVSNPPYVQQEEDILMQKHVVDYEPHLAMFVSQNDPLVFFECIIEIACRNLNEKGKLYFEINEFSGLQVEKLLKAAKFDNVKIVKDINGKNRFATGSIK